MLKSDNTSSVIVKWEHFAKKFRTFEQERRKMEFWIPV